MRYFPVILLLFIYISCYSQKDISRVDSWKSYSIPLNADSLRNYQFDLKREWIVFLKNNKVLASRSRDKVSDALPFNITPTREEKYKISGRRSVIKVEDGYLVGFYRGEWGGNLYWFSKDGKNKYEISEHEIVQFMKRDNEIYAIEGLAHLSISEGSIIKIKKVNNKWTVSEYVKLPSAPEGVDLDVRNNFVIITSKSLLIVDPTSKIDTLIAEGFWWAGLYPTSLVIKDNIVYVGMRKGIFRYELATQKQQWLMKE